MNKKVLITGCTGQDGSYLAELLLEKGYEVYGLYRRSAAPNFSNILHMQDKVNLVCGDLTDPASINEVISSLHFDEVYNLAAQSFVGASFKQARLTFEIDTLGVLNLLEAIKNYSPNTKFYQASTSEMFGSNYSVAYPDKINLQDLANNLSYPFLENKPELKPLYEKYQDEETPFRPESPYAVAKVAAHHLCQLYRKAYNMHVSCGILFNHESPRRGIEFVTRKITDYVGKLKNNQRLGIETPKLKLGNLDSYRDWGHAKDYVEGMWRMLQQDVPDDYVLCTGETHSIRDFLSSAFSVAMIDGWENYVEQDPAFMRPSEVPYLKGSYSKAKEKLGWAPTTSFLNLVTDMVNNDYSRNKS